MIQYFHKFKKYLNKPLSVEDINDINYYCEKRWFIQITKQFGIATTLILIEFYKSEEEYLICKDIVVSIENSNKYFGTTYPLTLSEYENMS